MERHTGEAMKKTYRRIFKAHEESGGILMELLLSIALVSVVIPFILKYQENAVRRTENIAVVRHMEKIEDSLERYIVDNREELLKTVGKTIIRVQAKDLIDYGVPEEVIDNNNYQLRILKSSGLGDRATLQGVVVYNDENISPIRTREIVSLGGGSMGFVDGTKAYGTFGAWRTDLIDMGVPKANGLIGTTNVNRETASYLWRKPSDNPEDAMMLSALNLGNHDIENFGFVNSNFLRLTGVLSSPEIVAKDTIFQNRTTIDSNFKAKQGIVAGIMSADSRTMEVNNTFNLEDVGKFSSFTTGDLWVSKMTLPNISIDGASDYNIAEMNINKTIDMTAGRIDALQVSVGYTGSITPKLIVRNLIQDSRNPNYYWDINSKTAYFNDIILNQLNYKAQWAISSEKGKNTITTQIFKAVTTNKNATVSDYMNAIEEIQKKVTEKYRQLNLE